jgi:glycosyltransferase involved in cell wall biosynthesis
VSARSTKGSAAQGVLVFVPTYNDHTHIAKIEEDIAALGIGARILVIDDGSAEPVQTGRDTLIYRAPANVGLGVTTNIALDHAFRGGYRALIRLDADGQHNSADIPSLLALIDNGQADLVAGVRSNHMTLRSVSGVVRAMVKAYFRFSSALATGGRAPRDVNTGFFALNREAIRVLGKFEFERFPEPEIFVRACRSGLRLAEVSVKQEERTVGRSTLRIPDALRMVWRFTVFLINDMLGSRRS